MTDTIGKSLVTMNCFEYIFPYITIGTIATVVAFKKDSLVLKEGHSNNFYYRVKEGRVRVLKRRSEDEDMSDADQSDESLVNKSVVLHVLGKGSMFGEISLLQPSGIVTASIVADDDVVLYQITSSDLKEFFEKHLDIAEKVFREMALVQVIIAKNTKLSCLQL